MKSNKCILEIDLSKICANYRLLRRQCKNSIVSAAVKANAYGLGADKVSLALQQEGCKDFFVANVEEGKDLRDSGIKGNIFCLNGVCEDYLELILKHNLVPVLNSIEQINFYRNFAVKVGKKLPCLLHFNTGMNRLGMPKYEIEHLSNNKNLLEGVEVKYIISHLSASEETNNPYNQKQLNEFKAHSRLFPGIPLSLANSCGVFLGSEYFFNLVRPGAALYGIWPVGYMKNPVKLSAPIIQLQNLQIGERVGYNMTFTTTKPSVIATLPIGYADGYPRSLSNIGKVYIGDTPASIVGIVAMDLVTVDVTEFHPSKVSVGQYVEIIGEHYTPSQIGAICGTNGYEILTRLNTSKRFEVRYTIN